MTHIAIQCLLLMVLDCLPSTLRVDDAYQRMPTHQMVKDDQAGKEGMHACLQKRGARGMIIN